MTDLEEIALLDATDQAALVRGRQIKAIELVESAIDRIERLNPIFNAVITEMYEQGRRAAEDPIPNGPFAGVPFLLKDVLAEYAGVRYTASSVFLSDHVSDVDTELVKRYKQAGLITVGKTNTPELAIGVSTEPHLFGAVHNPWDVDRTAGGSSGGSAAAVAAGMVPMAHGNDVGGSIRIPASCCGVFGLKPTRARNPSGPHYGDLFSGLLVEHALTRSVRDSATLLDATSGPELGDPYEVPLPERSYLQEVGADPGRLHIAFTVETPWGTTVHPDCAEAVREAAELCAGLGHEVVEAAPTFDAELLWQSFTKVISAGVAWVVEDLARRTNRSPSAELFEPFIWAFTKRGRQLSAPDYLLVIQDLQRISRQIARFFSSYDVWLTPTLGEPPVTLGTFSFNDGDPFELRRRMATFSPFTYLFNITGQPAMSVPLYWNFEGLPVGTHFAARSGQEATLFRLAAQLETARPWADRRPPEAA